MSNGFPNRSIAGVSRKACLSDRASFTRRLLGSRTMPNPHKLKTGRTGRMTGMRGIGLGSIGGDRRGARDRGDCRLDRGAAETIETRKIRQRADLLSHEATVG